MIRAVVILAAVNQTSVWETCKENDQAPCDETVINWLHTIDRGWLEFAANLLFIRLAMAILVVRRAAPANRVPTMPDSVVAATEGVQPDGGEYRILVPLANPEHESDLITLASAIAKQLGGIVEAVHIINVPDQTSLEYASEKFDTEKDNSQALLDAAIRDAESFGVQIETSTIFSHRSFEQIFDAARTHDADLVVMGWGPDAHGSPGRIESAIDDLEGSLPCDFLALKDQEVNPGRILVPTAGGPSSDLAAEVAQLLQGEYDSQITLVHVADDQETGQLFLEEWATARGLEEAELLIKTGSVEKAIKQAAEDCSLVIIGATGRGLLSRVVRGSAVVGAAEDADCSVVLAERPTRRSLRERLFGR